MTQVRFGLRMNQRNQATTQYVGYDFDSMAVWGDRPLGIDDNGIYELFTGDTDSGERIDAWLDLPQVNFGTLALKRIRAVLVGARVDGSLRVSVAEDDRAERQYYLAASFSDNQHLLRATAGRNWHKGCYYTIGIENRNGEDFLLDLIQAVPIILSRKPVEW